MSATGNGGDERRPQPRTSAPQGWGPTSHNAGRAPGAPGAPAAGGPGGTPPRGRRRAKKAKPDTVGPDASWMQRRLAHRRRRRNVKKARLAAMTRSRRVLRRGLLAGTWFLGLIAVLMVAVIVAFYTLTNVPQPQALPLPQVATIEYSDGSTLARIGNVDRTIVHLSQVPTNVRYAVLAAEDRSFYTEDAVSVRGTVRAALSDLSGGNTQGGSGITQQYVKNAYLSNSQTISRKLKELMIAVKLSRNYSKNQILEYYLNTVYFGRGAYGIQAAAQAFFGVNVEKLTTAQGALLAGLLRAPSYYDPAANPTQARERWQYVLDGMVKTHHLTTAQETAMPFPKTHRAEGHRPRRHRLEAAAGECGAGRPRVARHHQGPGRQAGPAYPHDDQPQGAEGGPDRDQQELRQPDQQAEEPEELPRRRRPEIRRRAGLLRRIRAGREGL